MGPGELLDLFVQDTADQVRELEQGLILLERSPGDEGLLNRVFRAVHTLKGNAGIVGLETLAELAHSMETLLDGVRRGRLTPGEDAVSALLAGLDLIRQLVAEARSPAPPDRSEEVRALSERLAGLHRVRAVEAQGTPRGIALQPMPSEASTFDVHLHFAPDVLASGHDPLILLEEMHNIGRVTRVEPDLGALPELGALATGQACLSWSLRLECPGGRKSIEQLLAFLPAGNRCTITPVAPDAAMAEASVAQPREAQAVTATLAPAPPAPAPASPPEPAAPASAPAAAPDVEPQARPRAVAAAGQAQPETVQRSDTVRVGVRVLDRLMSLAGDMVLVRNQLLQSTSGGDLGQVERVAQRVDVLTGELQDAIMATRMQSIRVVFDKFSRSVRDLAHDLGKRVRLNIEDEGVELDKTVIEAIADPLSHLVRNAVDHGLEAPRDRLAAGKPAEGTLTLRAWHGAGQVVVDVIDDGRGVDPEKVRARAVALGLVPPEEARAMTPREARDLVFLPGFSTADSVTQVSGRGVGLDVVQTNLASIGGSVQLESEPGRGCLLRIRLPLTLAILPSLLVDVQGERFAVPQVNLVELVRLRPDDLRRRIEKVGGVEVLRVRDALVPVVALRALLGVDQPTFRDPASGDRLPDRRRNVADRRAEEGDSADGLHPERRGGPDRRASRQSAVNLAVVSAGDDEYGLVVDGFLDSLEIVVKPLGRNLNACQCYAGATVLGDGRAALILDVVGLARKARIASKTAAARSLRRGSQAVGEGEAQRVPLLLVEGGGRELFGLPLEMVEHVRRTRREEVAIVAGRRVLRREHTTLPLLAPEDVLPVAPLAPRDSFPVVVFRASGREHGLVLEEVVDIVEVDPAFAPLVERQRGAKGSTVVGERVALVLDLRDLVGDVAPAPAQPATPAAGPPSAPRRTVLVVDDSPFFLNHISALMEEAGYDVTRAHDGREGLEILTHAPGRFDLVLTDIEMPEMNGFEMVERLRRVPGLERLPVIAVTSLLGAEAEERGRQVGIDEYSIKLDRDDVLERSRRLLEQGRRYQ
jgi:two-component system chemotaxis sensor kinase CheA